LLGTALAVMNAHLAEQAVTKINRQGTGNRVQTSAPSDVFATADGHILVHTVGDGLFRRWTKMVGRPELAEDPRYQGDQARGDRRDELCAIMADWCRVRTSAEALAALDAAGVPSGPVLTQQQALDNPQAEAMGFFKWISVSGATSPAPVVDLPIRFSSLAAGAAGRPPFLGEHTTAVLRDAGFTEAEIGRLKKGGVI
jgi:crotonobetainyl-CoA:carnitine CoA-transferase CaiB-like acyl-CoA transferase